MYFGRVGVILGATVGGLAGAALAARWGLSRQAAQARAVIGKPLGEQALNADRVWKKRLGEPIHLVVLGDSIAAGLGADRPRETFGARLSKRVAKRTEHSVKLTTAAWVGAESSDLPAQIASISPEARPDVAVIIVGGNDVTHRVPVARSVEHLVAAIEHFNGIGTPVVVGTCPDLGALRAVPQPLRALGSRSSRQLADAQAAAALAAGARVVSLRHVVGAFFYTQPDEMFSEDAFHPSAQGYRRTAKAVAPSVLAALGYLDDVPFGHFAPADPPIPPGLANVVLAPTLER